jgi:hypothetical protein
MSDCSGFILPSSTCRISLGLVATWPTFTSPVRPSNDTHSPSFSVCPCTVNVLLFSLICRSPAPTTEGLPIWRPTTAACDVMPPVAVRTPWATSMPWMSSGTVSFRTSSTFLPCWAHSTAWSAVKTTWPDAAPGEAGSPRVATGSFFHSAGSNTGDSSCESDIGSTCSSASRGVMMRSAAMSVAMTTAA